jgi:hypothetical protein
MRVDEGVGTVVCWGWKVAKKRLGWKEEFDGEIRGQPCHMEKMGLNGTEPFSRLDEN